MGHDNFIVYLVHFQFLGLVREGSRRLLASELVNTCTHVLRPLTNLLQPAFETKSTVFIRPEVEAIHFWPETIPKTSPTKDCPGSCQDEENDCQDACSPEFSSALQAAVCASDCPASEPLGNCTFQCFDDDYYGGYDYAFPYGYGGDGDAYFCLFWIRFLLS